MSNKHDYLTDSDESDEDERYENNHVEISEEDDDTVFNFESTLKPQIKEDLVPLLRDLKTPDKKSLEENFGTLKPGDAFGESCLYSIDSESFQDKPRFYQAIALTDSYYMTLSIS